jgi:hypothetical protein
MLRFDRDTGLSADLIGSLGPDAPVAYLVEQPTAQQLEELAEHEPSVDDSQDETDPIIPIVLGVVPGYDITLLDVRRTAGSASMPGPEHEVLRPAVLIRGAHLTDGFETPVDSLGVSFDGLDDWYDTALVGDNFPTTITRDETGTTIRWVNPQKIEASLAGGDVVAVSPRPERHISAREVRIGVRPEYSIRYTKPVPLREATKIHTPLRWLTSLITRSPARLTGLRGVESGALQDFEVIFQSTEPDGERGHIHPFAMALTLPNFEFSNRLPKWLENAEQFRVPMALLFANWFSTGLYAENRVLNASSAAESLANLLYKGTRTELSDRPAAVAAFIAAFPEDEHELLRQRLENINDASLRQRLRQLTAGAGGAFDLVVDKTDRWISLVVKARNDIAHGTRLHDDGARLLALSETLEHLIEVHLLMELGMTSLEVEVALRETRRTRWIADLAERYME